MDDPTVGQTSRRYTVGNTLGTAGLVVALALAAFVGVIGAHAYMSQAPWRAFKPAGQTIAQTNSGPPGFAEIVDRVKPAVIGVQAKVVDNEQRSAGSSLDRFFRQFGVPQRTPDATDVPRAGRVTAQGSGFFISADGYAVTNNHVVEGSTTAEIQTDDHQTYIAKVVGTGKPVNSSTELHTAFDNARDEGKRTIVMRIRSGDTTRFVALPTG